MKSPRFRFLTKFPRKNLYLVFLTLGVITTAASAVYYQNLKFSKQIQERTQKQKGLENLLQTAKKDLDALKNEDQYKRNEALSKDIKSIEQTYKQAVQTYEKLLVLRDKDKQSKETAKLEALFAQSLKELSEKNYSSASSTLASLQKGIDERNNQLDSEFAIPESVQTQSAPPSSGHRRQRVDTEIGSYLIDIIAADLSSTRVIVDTASDSTCTSNCPVLALSEYVARNGAYAGVNGSYFCPSTYPTCAGKENSFDTLLMNKNKVYFNSDNNMYSTVPAVIFLGGSVRFVSRSLDWGRDTGVDGVIANQPLLLLDGNIAFGGDGDPKKGGKGSRSFVGSTGSTVYIGIVHNATVAEVAHVLKVLGVSNALNLDSGGSTALWFNGYKAGPGRNIPNAIIFVRK